VHHYGDTVRGHPHIELDRVGAAVDRRLERLDRILGEVPGITAVRHHRGSRRLTEWPFRHYRRLHAGSLTARTDRRAT
jgi:hypothetical protein